MASKKKVNFYKQFVTKDSETKEMAFCLPESKAVEFFAKFFEDSGVCDEGDEHRDNLLKYLFGIQPFTLKATTFAKANVTLTVSAKSKTEAIRLARTQYENKEVVLDSDNSEIMLAGVSADGENVKYVLRDVQPKNR